MADEEKVPLEEATEVPDYDEADLAEAEEVSTARKDTHVAMHSTGWKEFMLHPPLLQAISDCGFEHPSEVQHAVIPQALLGNDIICQAKSGMGKTAVFIITVIQRCKEPNELGAIVVAHARELAMQICKEFNRFVKYLPKIKCAAFCGGMPLEKQAKELAEEKPYVVCGTPGRLMDLVQKNLIDLSTLKHFVVDECDKVLCESDMRAQVQKVFTAAPKKKQVMMFSATLSPEMRRLCKMYTRSALEFYIDEGEKLTLYGLRQYCFPIKEEDKNRKLVEILDGLEFNQTIIFVRTVVRAKTLDRMLHEVNFPSICIHSDMDAQERIDRFEQFKEGQRRLLIATDLMGRGIDVESVNVVINYDMPTDPDQYLHRVGRAGRFGTKGLAVSFISTKEDGEILEQVQQRFSVKIPEMPDIDDIDPNWYHGA